MSSYEYILFDLDGTLTDSGNGIINSVIYALNRFGINENDRNALKKFIGPPLITSFCEFYGFDRQKAVEAVKYYREYYREKGIFENLVYGGIPETLAKLKANGKKLILATSKPEMFAVKILEHFNLSRYFDFTAGAASDESRSEKTDVIAYVLSALKIDKLKSVIMVGDRNYDILGAKQNGIASLGVLYGYGSREELEAAGADFIAESVLQMQAFLAD